MTRQLMFSKLGITTGALLLALPFGGAVATSVLLGATIGTAANHCFARRIFDPRFPGRAGPTAGLYRAEFTKLLVAGALFGALFASAGDWNLLALLGGYLAVHLGAGVAALFLEPSAGR